MALRATCQKLPKDIFFSDKYLIIKKKELVILMAWEIERFISSLTDNNILPANLVRIMVNKTGFNILIIVTNALLGKR